MAEKATKATKTKTKKDNKGTLVGICVGCIALVVVIVLAVVLATKNQGINDSYFVSDDTKYVITIDSDEVDGEEEAYTPIKTHIVYTYEGDKVTGLKSYYEYKDASAAKTALEAMKATGEDLGDIALDGKYIVMTASEEDYKDLTTSDVKQQIEFMESLKNMNLDEVEGEEDVEEVEEVDSEE